MKLSRIIIITIILITAVYLFIREGKYSDGQRIIPVFGKRADVPSNVKAFISSTNTQRSQIAQELSNRCIKIKVGFSGVHNGKSIKGYWSFNRKNKSFAKILAPVKLLLRSEAPVSSMIPDLGAGGYWIDFYISPNMAYRTQFVGDCFLIHEKSIDNTRYTGGKEDVMIGLLIMKCPKWFADKVFAATHPLWKQMEEKKDHH